MREFFHGWQRRTGFVLLVVTLAMTGLWCRSQFENDSILFFFAQRQYQFESSKGHCVRMSWKVGRGIHEWGWNSSQFHFPNLIIEERDFDHDFKSSAVPFWPAVLTLSVLSAYLIVWKPLRK